jgi:hypothetical protein
MACVATNMTCVVGQTVWYKRPENDLEKAQLEVRLQTTPHPACACCQESDLQMRESYRIRGMYVTRR